MDFSKMMKEAQRLQKEMMEAQKRLEEMTFEGIAGGNMVSVVLSGNGDMKSVAIDDSLLDDKSIIEDLVVAAFRDARAKLEEKKNAVMGGVTQGMPAGLF